ncbi:hypothetical protein OIDMADRAFT_20795 [Oidiodendron maius Zn]|uniref:Uncharacterized protein n=1 Tax=Oidiodendron maius (strain Zn) TaxID=913774 RepID=A0A0C3D3C4_OIDMZ|nr:hypothetical protein OIDMADRAFT_20795 [Oidiodendron maius Zn]
MVPNKVNKVVLIRDRPKITEFIYKDSLRISLTIAELEGAVSMSYNLKVTLDRE